MNVSFAPIVNTLRSQGLKACATVFLGGPYRMTCDDGRMFVTFMWREGDFSIEVEESGEVVFEEYYLACPYSAALMYPDVRPGLVHMETGVSVFGALEAFTLGKGTLLQRAEKSVHEGMNDFPKFSPKECIETIPDFYQKSPFDLILTTEGELGLVERNPQTNLKKSIILHEKIEMYLFLGWFAIHCPRADKPSDRLSQVSDVYNHIQRGPFFSRQTFE